jgi:hypothetical protein
VGDYDRENSPERNKMTSNNVNNNHHHHNHTYIHKPVTEHEDVTVLWNQGIQTDRGFGKQA